MLSLIEFSNYIQHLGLMNDQVGRMRAVLNDPLYAEIQSDFVDPYCFFNPRLEQDIIDLLVHCMEDEDEWIPYFIFELDFGRRWHEGIVTDEDGNDIKLETIVDLYVLLTK